MLLYFFKPSFLLSYNVLSGRIKSFAVNYSVRQRSLSMLKQNCSVKLEVQKKKNLICDGIHVSFEMK